MYTIPLSYVELRRKTPFWRCSFPQFASLYGCATRTQGYLLEPLQDDRRMLAKPQSLVCRQNRRIHTGDNGLNGQTIRKNLPAVFLENVTLGPAAWADVCLDRIGV